MTIMPKQDDLLERPPWHRRWWIWLLAASLLGIVLYTQLSKSGRPAEAPGKPGAAIMQPNVAVTAVPAKKGDIGIYLTGLGSVTPIHTVTVKSRVDGELLKVYYKEGETVKKGALIAEIDPRPYQAQLTQAQGQMIRDQALLRNAKLDLQRYRRIGPYIPIMRERLAAVLQIAVDRVNVKGTTAKGLGWLGAGDGIATIAVACVAPLPTGRPDVSSHRTRRTRGRR